jgi:hypothetical protein
VAETSILICYERWVEKLKYEEVGRMLRSMADNPDKFFPK